MQIRKSIYYLGGLCLLSILNGCATSSKDFKDPYEDWNRGVQTFNDKLDEYALKPVAEGYNTVMPEFADVAVTNFFNNIDDIGVTLNDLLQFKFHQSGLDSARFLVNSTVGVGGLIDVAQKIDLSKHNEDFDQTLGYWGVPTGPYLVLPFFGPSSPRGLTGRIADAAMNPINYVGSAVITLPLNATKIIDTRSDLLGAGNVAKEASVDRYDFFKNSYFQRRNFLVNDGQVKDDADIDLEVDQPSAKGSR